jgi:hypothetical protein
LSRAAACWNAWVFVVLLAASCGSDTSGGDAAVDASVDADASMDLSVEAPMDASMDLSIEVPTDASTDLYEDAASSTPIDSAVPCTNLCLLQGTCDAGPATLSGKVVAGTLAKYLPVGATDGDPVPGVLVYIPNGTVLPFTPRSAETQPQQCSSCGAEVSGAPLVKTTTDANGNFTLMNVPVGSSIPLVIQLGRWRRQLILGTTTCGANSVSIVGMTPGTLRMPRTSAEGDIPLTAISTGSNDAMECVLLKMGVDASEFVAYSAGVTGRVHLYRGNGAIASNGGTTPPETTLMGTTTSNGTYNDYDQIVLPCWGVDPTTAGSANTKTVAALANLVTYGDNGGRFFATHFSYTWLYNNPPYSATAVWDVDHNTNIPSMSGAVSTAVPAANAGLFLQWLQNVGALTTYTASPPAGTVTINAARHDVDSVVAPSLSWIDGVDPADSSAMLLHYSFDTPVAQADAGPIAQCGHAIFSDFHENNSGLTAGGNVCNLNSDCPSLDCVGAGGACTSGASCTSGSCNGAHMCRGLCATVQFPSQSDLATYCGATPMTAQEKILEYMIWDLSPPECVQ